MGSINYITTIVNMRALGMTFFRMPLVIWSLFIVAILLLLALPVLTSALAMLLLDRMAGTSFFLPAGGGEPLLWQHLFWFFGHPEVYILILPAMGIGSDILAVFARKPIFGYRAMAFSMIGIAFLSWIVWGHHMFQSGMNPALGTGFMISTMVIAVPSAIKTFNWLGTLWGGSIRYTTPMLNALAFVSMFVIGGLSGIYMASTPVDIFIHDTYYIVAHIHYVVFGGSVFGIFAAIYYWFPKMFGRMMNETLGKIHFWPTFIAFNCTFFPMHILGIGGHMRRIYNPMQYEFLRPLQPVNVFITVSAIALGLAQIPFVINFFWSLFAGKKAERNPWKANTLEWVAPSPPPHGNFETIPVVYRGPYEYSSPEVAEDYLPQNRPLVSARVTAAH
jgi:cytochrome c oxidase subunit 1